VPALPNERVADVTIRAARTSDAAVLATLICDLGYKTTMVEMQTRLQNIAADARYRAWVALVQDNVQGMIGTFAHHSFEHNDLSGRILALVVAPTARRRGIGQRLIAAAENDFAQRNIRRIALDTRFEREQAHRFYEALGYRRNGFRFVKTLR
jgi:ribosomal protein S18 acetylase RimI-like enzyme